MMAVVVLVLVPVLVRGRVEVQVEGQLRYGWNADVQPFRCQNLQKKVMTVLYQNGRLVRVQVLTKFHVLRDG